MAFFNGKTVTLLPLRDLCRDTLLRMEEETSPAPSGNQTYEHSVTRGVLYHCDTTTAQIVISLIKIFTRLACLRAAITGRVVGDIAQR